MVGLSERQHATNRSLYKVPVLGGGPRKILEEHG
jgi:hypothetical protein